MRICFVIADISEGGGTQRVTTQIANGLVTKGYEVHILAFRNGIVSAFHIDERVIVHSLHAERVKNSLKRKYRNTELLYSYIKNKKIDVSIAVESYIYLYLLPVQLKKSCKCIAWEHSNYYISNMSTARIGRFLATRFSNKVIVLGKNDYRSFIQHYGHKKKITYIYNPVAFNIEQHKHIDTHRILAAGRLSYEKGFDLLIEAWAKIEHQAGDWILDIYGEGLLHEMLEKKILALKLERIHLCGFTNNLEDEMRNSSIFVLSSRNEGFVLVLIEAQSKGMPCISFNCKEGPAEIIDDGVNGYLVEAGNVDCLSEKILDLINDKNKRISFSSHSQKDIERFNPLKIIEKWDEMLQKLR